MRRPILAGILLLVAAPAAATELRVAVAANFITTLERLAEAYAPENGVRFAISSGSSGKHFAQIRQGAPSISSSPRMISGQRIWSRVAMPPPTAALSMPKGYWRFGVRIPASSRKTPSPS